MSRVPSKAVRPARSVASSPAVAGFRPAGAALAVAAAFALLPPAAMAQPTGAQVIQGSASFAQSGGNLTVTTRNAAGTNFSAINWQSFSVPAGTVTRFDQPSASSTSINRVLGPDPSAIFGTLSSNGRLVLVNPAGITVGQGAVVDTAAFTASTLKMSDADALAGRLQFGAPGGGLLQVDGKVIARSGDVVLVAPQLQAGSSALVRSHGAAVLAAGHKVEITGRGLEGIRMEVQAGDRAVNLGTLQGDAVGVFAHTLHHSGVIEAQAAGVEGGKVVLRASGGDALVDGAIAARGVDGHGGAIDVFGQRVGLLAGANVDASGAAGGGQVRIGGDYQGRDAGVPNAARTFVDAQASIRADATGQGDGGRVIVWSDEATRMEGRISARGGALAGNGGFVEVSGRQTLGFRGGVDLSAPQGRNGTLLLDPDDITITAAGPDTDPRSTTSTGDTQFGGGTGESTISASTLNAILSGSGDVLVRTSSGSLGAHGGQITLAADANLSWTGANCLSLDADAGIALEGNVNAGKGALSLVAGNGSIGQASTSSIVVGGLYASAANGSVNLTSSGNRIAQIAGSASGVGAGFAVNNTGSLTIGSVAAGPTASPYASGSGISAAGAVAITTSGALAIASSVGVQGGSVTLAGAGVSAGDATTVSATTAGAGVSISSSAGIDFGAGTASVATNGGPIHITAADSILGNVDLASSPSTASSGTVSVTSSGGSISVGSISARGADAPASMGPLGGGAGSVTLSAAGDIDVGAANIVGGAGSSGGAGGAAGSLAIDAGRTARIGNVVAYGGQGTGSAAGGAGGNVSITAAGAIVVEATNYPAIWADGGSSDAGAGGAGGSVFLASAGGGIQLATRNGQTVTSMPSGISAIGGRGASGGQGGSVTLDAGGAIAADLLVADGGQSSGASGATGQAGGAGGAIHVRTGGGLTATVLQARGGDGAGATSGGTGGAGGSVAVESRSGNLDLFHVSVLSAGGGSGGSATMGGAGHGGAGGNGGAVSLSAPGGALVLAGSRLVLDASGGAGGLESDDSTPAAGGALGTLAASGNAVEIQGGVALDAQWHNALAVNVHGASSVSGIGSFTNSGTLKLLDTANFMPAGGIANVAGGQVVTGSAASASANLLQNAGRVDVVAGSTLSVPMALSNTGTVNVDGKLELGERQATTRTALVAAAATAPALFTNQASGLLTGAGTIAVAGGSGTLDNFGTIAPGGAGVIGTLSIDGNLAMESGSTLAIDLLSPAAYDSLGVAGSAQTGGSVAVSYRPGSSFQRGDSFRLLQSGTLDARNLPSINVPQLALRPDATALLAIANAPYPAAPAPMPAQAPAAQQVANQVVTFAQLFVQEAHNQASQRPKDRDSIVTTDNACKP